VSGDEPSIRAPASFTSEVLRRDVLSSRSAPRPLM